MNEEQVKVTFEDVDFTVTCDAEKYGNDITFSIVGIQDELGNSMYDSSKICALCEHFRQLDLEEIESLPTRLEVLVFFESHAGQTAVYSALETLAEGYGSNNYFTED